MVIAECFLDSNRGIWDYIFSESHRDDGTQLAAAFNDCLLMLDRIIILQVV